MKKSIYIFLFALLAISCENINIETADTDKAVVEGYLIPGNFIELSVAKQIVFDTENDEISPINNLTIRLNDGVNEEILLMEEEGIYKTQSMIAEEANKQKIARDMIQLGFRYFQSRYKKTSYRAKINLTATIFLNSQKLSNSYKK